MNNKIFNIIIVVLVLVVFGLTYLLYTSDKGFDNITKITYLKNDKKVDKKLEQDFENWKNDQVRNYEHGVDLKFGSGNVINMEIEAMEKELELVPGVLTKMNTYNNDGIEPLIIRAKKGDMLVVNFKNFLKDSSTIHWHGVRLGNSQDGVAGITQEPVESGYNYKYEFVLNDAGTFLFHPHVNHVEQVGRGLYGVLIVEDEQEPKYDKEFVWVLKDYRVGQGGKLVDDFGNLHDGVHGGRIGNLVTINNKINFEENVNLGETIRLRLANLSNARIYDLDFSKFDAKVIATDDGLVSNPKKISKLEIGPGERYDLEIKISEIDEDLVLYDKYFSQYQNDVKIATLKIVGNDDFFGNINTPVGNVPDWSDAAEYNKPDVVIDLGGVGVMGGDKGMMMGMNAERGWTINDGIYPDSSKPIKLKKGKMYVIRMKNNSSRDHPMHLHGDFFQVVSVNGEKGEFIGWKDTANVKPLSYIDVAMIPTNVGTWAFHCHILEHADLGMFTTFEIEE